MDDAGFILGSYLLTFAAVALFSWRTVRAARRLADQMARFDHADIDAKTINRRQAAQLAFEHDLARFGDGRRIAEIAQDPLLRRYDTLILDEAHERTLHTDVLLGLIKDVARYVPHEHGDEAAFERQVERASVEHSLANMRTFPWIRMRENAGELSIHGAWFDISLGELHAYDEAAKSWDVIS